MRGCSTSPHERRFEHIVLCRTTLKETTVLVDSGLGFERVDPDPMHLSLNLTYIRLLHAMSRRSKESCNLLLCVASDCILTLG